MTAGQHLQDESFDHPDLYSSSNFYGEDLSTSQPSQRALNLWPLWRMVRRNAFLISGITSLVAAPLILSALNAPKQYEGNFRILVEPTTAQANATDPSAISRDRTAELPATTVDYATLLQVLRSPGILSKIAAEVQPRYPDVTADSLYRELLNKTLIVRQVNTGGDPIRAEEGTPSKVIEVVYSGQDPQQVQFILDKLKDGYLRYSLEDRKTRIYGGVQFIDAQLPELQRRVNTLQNKLQTLKQRYRLSTPTADNDALATQARDLRTQRLQAQRELAEQVTLYSRLQNQIGMGPDEALAASALSSNPRYQELLGKLKEVEAQIAIKSARFSDASPVLKTLQEQQKNLNQLLETEARRNLSSGPTSISPNSRVLAYQDPTRVALIQQLATTANNVQVLQVRNQALAQTQTFLDSQLQQFPAVVRQYTDLQQQLDIATRTLTQFLTQRETLRIEGAQKEVPWELIAAPVVPKDAQGNFVPVPQKATKQILLGLAVGLLLGLAAAFLKEKRADVFYCSDDLIDGTKLPLLGELPFNRSVEQLVTLPDIASLGSISKVFTSLFTSLRFPSSHSPIQSLVVGSAEPGDGKTTVALYLAQTAAAMGQRVLLVDADLRSPQVHTQFNLPNKLGLSELLLNQAGLEEAIQHPPFEKNLSVLTAGQVSMEAIKQLSSNSIQSLMKQLNSSFDLVIYDSPDLFEFADTNFLVPQTDGVLIVVGLGKTKRSALKQVLSELNQYHLPILGMVANHPSRTSTQPDDRGFQSESVYESFNDMKTKSI